jgi:hypothetical protein
MTLARMISGRGRVGAQDVPHPIEHSSSFDQDRPFLEWARRPAQYPIVDDPDRPLSWRAIRNVSE